MSPIIIFATLLFNIDSSKALAPSTDIESTEPTEKPSIETKTTTIIKEQKQEQEEIQPPTPTTTQPTNTIDYPYIDSIPLSKELQQYTFKQCGKNEELYLLVMAIMQEESNFQIDAVGIDGHDLGLMQIRDINIEYLEEKLGCKVDLMDPYDNIKCGVTIVRELYEDYEYTNLVLMAYKYGRKGANGLWEKGIYSTKYTIIVTEYYNNLKSEVAR